MKFYKHIYFVLKALFRKKDENDHVHEYIKMIDCSGIVLFTSDANGNFTSASSRSEELTGYSVAEIIGKHFTFLIPQQYHERVFNFYLGQTLQQVQETFYEFPILTKQKQEKWVEQSAVLIIKDGKPAGYQCIVKDISEKKKAEEKLHHSLADLEKTRNEREIIEHRLQELLDNTPLMVFEKDLRGRYLFANKKFKEILGSADQNIIGKTAFDFDIPLNAEKYKDLDEQVITTLQNVQCEERIVSGDKSIVLQIFKCPLFDKEGKLYGIGGIASNITEKVEHQEKLVAAKIKAEAAEQLQEQFLANMSHEIRTPMNGIIGMANLLSETALEPKQQEFLKVIRQSSDQLMMLINHVLDLSKIKAGKLIIEKTDFSLHEEIENIIPPFRIKAQEKNLLFKHIVDVPKNIILSGDRLRLHQVLINLLSNALKFTSDGQVELEVTNLGIIDNQIALRFSISDTGIGIADELKEKVFESFVQADSGITRKFGGTGLGLSITKMLVELQGGKIHVKNNKPKGTSFSFTLKYEISHKLSSTTLIGKSALPDYSELSGKKILVVEDNEINQKVIQTYLSKASIISVIANNGKEAVEILGNENDVDLIIMDLQMPEMNGFQATAFIRKRMMIQTPIIAMTASALQNEKMKCFEIGMNEYLTKPFVPAEFFRVLKRFLLKRNNGLKCENHLTNKSQLYNLSNLLEMDDAEYFCDVLELFLHSTPVLLEEIKTQTLFENWEGVYKKAHKLKSSVGLLKMKELLKITELIEGQAKERRQLEEIPAQVNMLLEKFSIIQPLIQSELNEAREKMKVNAKI